MGLLCLQVEEVDREGIGTEGSSQLIRGHGLDLGFNINSLDLQFTGQASQFYLQCIRQIM
jgi:hypothetical protein